jgi:antitoxin MazE
MKTRLLKIGNSWGVRIPKRLLEEAGLEEAVELAVESGQIIIRPLEQKPRAPNTLTQGRLKTPLRWEDDEWEWK